MAAAIGEAGGDIEAIEIVEHRREGTAVDDVLLELSPGTMPDSVVSACNLLDGVHVLWISRYAAGGHLFLDLEAVEQMTSDPATALDALVDLLPATFRADWGMRAAHGVRVRGRALDLGRARAARRGRLARADQGRADRRPRRLAAARGGRRATRQRGRHRDDRRRGGPEILDSELARLGHLAALAVSITRTAELA